jgi:hypothetical protein
MACEILVSGMNVQQCISKVFHGWIVLIFV